MTMCKMFAVINRLDDTPIFVMQGEVGYWPCDPKDMDTWAAMHQKQGDGVTESAYGASICGWDAPIAKAALGAVGK